MQILASEMMHLLANIHQAVKAMQLTQEDFKVRSRNNVQDQEDLPAARRTLHKTGSTRPMHQHAQPAHAEVEQLLHTTQAPSSFAVGPHDGHGT
jgi:hypothetical protein